MDIWLFFSRHLFALKRAVLFSSRCDKTLPCFLEAPEFVFEASYDGWGHFSFHSELVCARHLQTTAQHLRTFFLPSHPACNFSAMHDEIFCKAGDVLGRWPTVIPSFMTAMLCLSPNVRPSGSGCVVNFSPITGSQ